MCDIIIHIGQCGAQLAESFWPYYTNIGKIELNDSNYYSNRYSQFYDQRYFKRMILVDSDFKKRNQLNKIANILSFLETERDLLVKNKKLFNYDEICYKGNNQTSLKCWANGYFENSRLLQSTLNSLRQRLDRMSKFTSLLIVHSLAGGMGSGFTSLLLEHLSDYYPGVFKICASVVPQSSGESPLQDYNTLLSLTYLQKYSDCIFWLDNDLFLNNGSKSTQANSFLECNNDMMSPLAALFDPSKIITPSNEAVEIVKSLCPVFNTKIATLCHPTLKQSSGYKSSSSLLDFSETELIRCFKNAKLDNSTVLECICRTPNIEQLENAFWNRSTCNRNLSNPINTLQKCLNSGFSETYGLRKDSAYFLTKYDVIPGKLGNNRFKIKYLTNLSNFKNTVGQKQHFTLALNQSGIIHLIKPKLNKFIQMMENGFYLHWYKKVGCDLSFFNESKQNAYDIIDSYKYIMERRYSHNWYMEIMLSLKYLYANVVYDKDADRLVAAIICSTKLPNDMRCNQEKCLIKSYSNLFMSPQVGYIVSLGVSESHRRHGIASRLLKKYLEHIDNFNKLTGNYFCIYMHTLVDNHAAIQFYLKHGFKNFEIRKDYYNINSTLCDAAILVQYLKPKSTINILFTAFKRFFSNYEQYACPIFLTILLVIYINLFVEIQNRYVAETLDKTDENVEYDHVKYAANELAESIPKRPKFDFWMYIPRKRFISVLKRVLFYSSFYSILAGFFAVLLGIVLSTLDITEPFLSNGTYIMGINPGMDFRPNIDGSFISFTQGEPSEYIHYTALIESFINAYKDEYIDTADLLDCPSDNVDIADNKFCKFDIKRLRQCTKEREYGFKFGKPCVLLKLNKMFNWTPIITKKTHDNMQEFYRNGYFSPDYKNSQFTNFNLVYVTCNGATPFDESNMGKLAYYPTQGFHVKHFPYRNQRGYQQPFVFVEFQNMTNSVAIQIICRVWADNIKHKFTTRSGMVTFQIRLD
ncbi:Sodium/potassium-transporting ATPase subunit beta-1 [Intoshia linei]|uniref:Sodium/potassium-transporting ATPase subunit beta-1 n=1 Tax=Intoshia linei TaxID=1819745 RepID=A0A177B6T7_9BILA|nr:Sodium/potassium-transporting ATPase subunit beta-1 [Intoshia linei]